MAVPSSPEAQGRSQRESPAWLQPLAAALSEALPRLLGTAPEPLVSELIGLLTAGLEMGELDVFLAGPPPAGVSAGAWPAGHRQALEATPLAASPEGPLVLEDDQLTWRRWHGRRQAVVSGGCSACCSTPPR
jgi:exodeoxyribonuclease V alpha subunit